MLRKMKTFLFDYFCLNKIFEELIGGNSNERNKPRKLRWNKRLFHIKTPIILNPIIPRLFGLKVSGNLNYMNLIQTLTDLLKLVQASIIKCKKKFIIGQWNNFKKEQESKWLNFGRLR